MENTQNDDVQICETEHLEEKPIVYEIDNHHKIIVSPIYQKSKATGKSINEILLNLMRWEIEKF